MAGINFDATQVAPNVGFAPVEKGKYPVVLSQSEFKPTNNGAGKKLELHATIQGGMNHGRSILFNLNWENQSEVAVKIGKGQFSAICHAVNVMHVQDTQQLHNIPFMLEVEVTPDGKYNEVIGIYPITGAMSQVQPTQLVNVQPVYQAPVQPQFVQQQPVYQQPVQPVYQAPVQPQPQYQAPVSQPTGQADIPDWIKNQQAAAAQAPMGNG